MTDWKSDWENGIKFMDDEHKTLINAVSKLNNAIEQSNDINKIFDFIYFLSNYVQYHFKHEEEVMIKYEYPDYNDHKQLHEFFIDDVKKIIKELTVRGPTLALADNINNRISNWLIHHIMVVDLKFARFLHKNNINE